MLLNPDVIVGFEKREIFNQLELIIKKFPQMSYEMIVYGFFTVR